MGDGAEDEGERECERDDERGQLAGIAHDGAEIIACGPA